MSKSDGRTGEQPLKPKTRFICFLSGRRMPFIYSGLSRYQDSVICFTSSSNGSKKWIRRILTLSEGFWLRSYLFSISFQHKKIKLDLNSKRKKLLKPYERFRHIIDRLFAGNYQKCSNSCLSIMLQTD